MSRLIAVAALLLVAVLAALYLTGADRVVQAWALDGQRAAQDAMAGGLRAMRAGDPAALGGFLAVCFGYGFFHAVGPGHGKLLIGGYGAATRVGAARLIWVALASSLAQALTAIGLVGIGLWAWRWGRAQMTDLAEAVFAPLSFAAVALVGLWLVARGLRGLVRLRRVSDHDHAGDHAVCDTCGHAHVPDPASVARAGNWKEVAALIGAVAIRPCTGALFVLILTAQMGIFAIGVAGTLSMALGTAAVTATVALGTVGLRRGVLAGLVGSARMSGVQPVLEITIGLVVAIIAGQFALASF